MDRSSGSPGWVPRKRNDINILLSIFMGLVFAVTPLGEYTITRYTCSEAEGTADCVTASGEECGIGTAASYPGQFPFGSILYVEGVGIVFITDTGTGYQDKKPWIDVWTGRGRDYAFEWGVRKRRVWLLEVNDD